MTRVLVTGGSGQLGRCIADLVGTLPFAHLEVVVLDRAGIDITDDESVATALRAHDPDVIVNAAAYTAVDAAETDVEAAMAANALGVERLARAGRRLIHVSTDYVFDGSKAGWYVESDPVAPVGVYGTTKRAGELAAEECRDHLVLRTAWVYSAYGHNFVKTMLRVGADRDHIRVVADQIGCPTSAHDLAEAILQLVDHEVTGTHHLTGTDEASWHEFAVAIFDHAGLEVEVEAIPTSAYPTPAPRPANSRLDSSAIAHTTGIRLPGWRTSLPAVIEQIRATSD
ncbi:MAG: dTDP-4-dehydrorhamnose reductase [Actinomycetota bacterium]